MPAASACRITGLDQHRVLAVAKNLPDRRKVAGDDRPPGSHVIEQLQRRREAIRNRRRRIRQDQDVGVGKTAPRVTRREHTGEDDAIG